MTAYHLNETSVHAGCPRAGDDAGRAPRGLRGVRIAVLARRALPRASTGTMDGV